MIAPGAGERLAAFPRQQIAGFVADPVGGDILLRRHEIARAFQSETPVDEDRGIQFPHQLEQFFRFPFFRIFPARPRIREIEPDDVDLSVFRQQFGHLVAHVFAVEMLVAGLVQFRPVQIAERMVVVDRELVVMPVEQGIIDAGADPFGAERLEDLADIIPFGFEIGVSRIEHAESVMMFCREHHVFHPGGFGQFRPFFRFETVRIEMVRILGILFRRKFFIGLHPFAAGGNAVNSPVDEHPEPGCLPPGAVSVCILRAHDPNPSVVPNRSGFEKWHIRFFFSRFSLILLIITEYSPLSRG